MPVYFLDIQGFKSSNILQVKELAVVPWDEMKLSTFCLFKSACSFSKLLHQEKKTNLWLERNFHGIPWNSGGVPYACHVRVLQDALRDAVKVYVKGVEKKKWLEETLPGKFHIVDMEELGCPSLWKLEKKCSWFCENHPLRSGAVCAAENAYSLKHWLLSRKEQITSGEDVVDIVYKEPIFVN